MEPLKILLVDDHDLFRSGVAALLALRPGIEVVGETGDGSEVLPLARQTRPDVILMDINMPSCSGINVIKTVKEEMPDVRVVMLTVSDSDRDLFAAIRNGADGYLVKSVKPDRLYEMLEGIRRRESPISDSLTGKILDELRRMDQMMDEREVLTRRDVEVLQLVARGATNKEIAQELCVTENTVKIHLHNMLQKLHLDNRVQAAMYAVRQGIVSG